MQAISTVNDLLAFLGSILIGTGAFAFVVIFLGKAIVRQLLFRDLEQFKSNLRQSSFEHEVRFSKLHEKRADVIAELYKRLVIFNQLMNRMMSPIRLGTGPSENEIKEAGDSGNAFLDYFFQHKIYFNEELCKKLESLHAKFYSAWLDYFMYPAQGPDARARQDSLFNAWRTIKEEIPPILSDIENEFRQLLGHGMTSESKK